MSEKTEITAKAYEEYKMLKKFEYKISDNYDALYQQILHMQLLVLAYFDNEAHHHAYNTDAVFNLIFDVCNEMYSAASEIQDIINARRTEK